MIAALVRWLLVLLALSIGVVGLLRWVDPPMSAFMFWQWVLAERSAPPPDDAPAWHYHWVDWEAIAKPVAIAVIAAEDQRFAYHRGFDVIELRQAWQQFQDGGQLRGASTISQQTAKNLFLWPGRDPLRKGLEAWFTILLETLWPKQRILEVYLNIAQFGPETYGVAAASQRYFHRSISELNTHKAALLAAVLPSPNRYQLAAPSPYVRQRAAWIRRQVQQLGGVGYLRRLSATATPVATTDTIPVLGHAHPLRSIRRYADETRYFIAPAAAAAPRTTFAHTGRTRHAGRHPPAS